RVKLVQPARTRKPPTIQIPALPKPAAKPADEDTDEHVPVAKAAEPEKRPVKSTEKPKDRVPPALQKKTPPAGTVVSLEELARSADDLDTGQVVKLQRAKPATRPTPTPTPAPPRPVPSSTRTTPTASTPPPSIVEGNTPRPARIPTSDIAELDADLVSEELPTTRAPAIKPADAAPPADDEVATVHAKKPADGDTADAPVVVEKRTPTEPPVLKVPDKKQPESRAARTPTEPPPPRDSLNDLPRGKFVYPVS